MLHPPIPHDEDQRLAALRKLGLLDTPAEQRFDWLVEFASTQLDMPIAVVSLVDDQRQWFKARVGLQASETPRHISFCAHAIASDDIFIVEDARADARFADNPLVTGGPHIRFYAGAPLKAPDGHRVGTLCVIDTRPRKLAAHELEALEALRQLASWDMATPPSADQAGQQPV